MTLTGDRCRCPTCREYFNSTTAFDKHRIGSFSVDRRCLNPTEMQAKGMSQNAGGFWITKKFTSQPLREGVLPAIGPDPGIGSAPAHYPGADHPTMIANAAQQ